MAYRHSPMNTAQRNDPNQLAFSDVTYMRHVSIATINLLFKVGCDINGFQWVASVAMGHWGTPPPQVLSKIFTLTPRAFRPLQLRRFEASNVHKRVKITNPYTAQLDCSRPTSIVRCLHSLTLISWIWEIDTTLHNKNYKKVCTSESHFAVVTYCVLVSKN